MAQISIIKLKDIKEAKRFDAEYFKPEYLEIERKLDSINSDFLFNLASNKYKRFDKTKCDKFDYIEISNINLTTGEYNTTQIECSESPSRAQKVCFKNDLLISTVRPNRNAVSLIQEDKDDLVASSGFCKLKNIKINPYYLFILFKTNLYIKQLVRHTTATMYPAVTEDDIKSLKIPLFSQSFQLQIEKIVKKAYKKLTQSKQLYKEAEQILLEELDLVNFKPKHKLTFTTTKKKIDQAKRFDAEYFQPKYEEMIKKIENYRGGFDNIKSIISWKKGIEVGSEAYTEQGKEFVRVSDFSKFGIENVSKKIDEKLFKEIKDKFQPKKGEILFTKDGTIGISYVLKEELNGVLSGAFLRLTLKEKYRNFEKEVLSLIFNSIIIKLQVKKLSGGALISHLKPSDFEQFKIPLIPTPIQTKIANKIKKSHKLRKEAKELLDKAKKAVEISIEKGEKEGLKFLKN